MTKILDMMDADLLGVFFQDFGVCVEPDTWGGSNFQGILDNELVELEERSLEAPSLVCPASRIPSDAAQGDLLTVDGTQYKILDIQIEDNLDIRRIILGTV